MLLTVTDLKKTFGTLVVLDGVSLTLDAGQSLALTGESGSGKSTFLHIVAGLEDADGGSVLVEGHRIDRMKDPERAALRRGMVGLVFQQFNLIPSLDVATNIAFQARLAGRFDQNRCDGLIHRLGLENHTEKYPEQLSGGLQQRVAIARTLAAKPKLILADEPTGNLDEDTGDAVITLMLELAAETGAGLMMVTHSDRLAQRLDARAHLSHGRFVT
jgi:putative ABC transport system ATP-binding protein